MLFGVRMVALALWIELRQHATGDGSDRRDFAFWLYLVGVLTFWGGLSSQSSGSKRGRISALWVRASMHRVG
jgi:hypothetical protein